MKGREMVQSVKYPLYDREELSSALHNPLKQLSVVLPTCNPSRGEVKMDKYEVGWPVSSRPIRDPVLKIMCMALEQ